MGILDFLKKNVKINDNLDLSESKILPKQDYSYVVDDNDEPMIVYYRPNSRLFVNKPIGNETKGYFLNIRCPLLIDVSGQNKIDIPPIPNGCDGIILKGYGIYNSTAFIVKDFNTQTMECPL